MRPVAPALVLVGLAVPLAACGGSETSTDTGSSQGGTVADAVEETFDAGTAKFTLTFEHTRDEATWGIEKGERDSLEGTVDFGQHRVEIGTDTDRVILDESAYYFRETDDSPWQQYSRDPESGDKPPPDVSLGRLDPVPVLEYVVAIESSFEAAGEEDVRGAPAARHTGLGEAEALMRALLSESLFSLLQWESHAVTVDRTDSAPLDVWVGEDGRVHKVVLDFPNFGSFVGDLTTIELHDFGADVDIELPVNAEPGD